jgi:hypothetical protein
MRLAERQFPLRDAEKFGAEVSLRSLPSMQLDNGNAAALSPPRTDS